MTPEQRRPRTSISAHDAERLLSGQTPASAHLVDLHAALGSLRDTARSRPTREAADDQARMLASAALEAVTTPGLSRQRHSLTRRSRPMKTRARIASIVGAAAALFLGATGAAMAAQTAVPGDALYGLKITLENVGLTEGGFPERLHEATVLLERGDEAEALTHLANALEDSGELPPCPAPGDDGGTASPSPSVSASSSPSPEPTTGVEDVESGDASEECVDDEASDELRRAAEAVLSGGSEQSLRVRTAVAEMLQWMATTDAEGRDFGQGVAERARAINGDADEDGAEGEDGTEDDGRGRPEHAGPPAGKGSGGGDDDEDGEDDGRGRPEHAGPPAGKGPGNGNGGGRP